MVKRKRNKMHFNISTSKQIDSNIYRMNIDINCSKESFSNNFSKWMNDIFHNIQMNNQDRISQALMLIKRAEHSHRDLCKQYFSDHANSLVNYVIGSATSEKLMKLRLKVLLLCLQYIPSVFGPFKTKIETFLSNLLKSDNKNLEESIKILSCCFSYLPILGGSGTNNQNYIVSWTTEFDRHLNRLEQILGHNMEHDVKFSIHCFAIINLMKLNLQSQIKIPIDRTLEIVSKVINYGANEEPFRNIDIEIKIYFSLDILSLLEGIIVKLGDLLWSYADMIFNFLVKFLRISNDVSTSNSLKCKLKCQIYSVISNCLLSNYPCRLQSILTVIRDSVINDAQPQSLNEVDTSLQVMEVTITRNKKRKRHTTESMNFFGSTTNNLSSKTYSHDWVDFESLEPICLAALKVLKAISAMDPVLINSEKNEVKKNWVEIMIPIWKFAVETLIKLRTYKDYMHPYASTKCRFHLFALMHQHISDNMFYTSRICARAYIALYGGIEDSDLRIRLLCHNMLATYKQFCSLKTDELNASNDQIFPMESLVNNNIFSSCRNIMLNDIQPSLINNKSTMIIENKQEEVNPIKNVPKNQFLDCSQINRCTSKDTSITLSDSQYTETDASQNYSIVTSNILNSEKMLYGNADSKASECKDTRNSEENLAIEIKENVLKDIFNFSSETSGPINSHELTLIGKTNLNENLNNKSKTEIDFMLASFVDANPD